MKETVSRVKRVLHMLYSMCRGHYVYQHEPQDWHGIGHGPVIRCSCGKRF